MMRTRVIGVMYLRLLRKRAWKVAAAGTQVFTRPLKVHSFDTIGVRCRFIATPLAQAVRVPHTLVSHVHTLVSHVRCLRLVTPNIALF